MTEIPEDLNSKATLVYGDIKNVIDHINQVGFTNLYIDGGKTIQSFIEANLISEMTITTVPVLIGEGISLFGKSNGLKKFNCVGNKLYPNGMVQNKFIRI
jgi:dihydrofolate reductase